MSGFGRELPQLGEPTTRMTYSRHECRTLTRPAQFKDERNREFADVVILQQLLRKQRSKSDVTKFLIEKDRTAPHTVLT
jgi:hypothetical protein